MPPDRFHMLLADLRRSWRGEMLFLGDSMEPVLHSGAVLTYLVCPEYEVGDIVFCRVNGRFIDAHRIVAKSDDRYLIANHAGRENGWTIEIFAKVVAVQPPSGVDHIQQGR
jgi:hypothetical protein